jgi:YesN/AraC family two-component response regulator
MQSTAPDRHLPGVLIVDDSECVRSFLRAALEATTRVVEAHDAERALKILANGNRNAIDLMLLDHVLPDRSGLDLLKITKRNWPWISVIILTGFGSEELAVQAFREGVKDYLRKPIAIDALKKTVAATLASTDNALRYSRHFAERSADGAVVHPNIHRALAFMHMHFSEPVSLSGVAQEAGLSRFHFCRLFRHETGTSFHVYLQRLRVSRALELLRDPYLRVSEVAYAVGFNDVSHFHRTFRKAVGQSPTKYRASLEY